MFENADRSGFEAQMVEADIPATVEGDITKTTRGLEEFALQSLELFEYIARDGEDLEVGPPDNEDPTDDGLIEEIVEYARGKQSLWVIALVEGRMTASQKFAEMVQWAQKEVSGWEADGEWARLEALKEQIREKMG